MVNNAERAQNPPNDSLTELLTELTEDADEGSLLGFERGAHGVTGRRKLLAPGLAVATYAEDQKQHMAELIAAETDEILDEPIGHVEFLKAQGKSSIGGGIYLSRAREAVVSVSIHHDTPSLYNGDAETCFNAATRLGLGEAWTKSLFAYFQDPSHSTQNLIVKLGPIQQQQLQETLVNPNLESSEAQAKTV